MAISLIFSSNYTSNAFHMLCVGHNEVFLRIPSTDENENLY
jgi:hypothetical protein